MAIKMTYAEDILKRQMKPEDEAKAKDIEAKRKATLEACASIGEAKGRYLKAKLKKRSVKQALSEDIFSELEEYKYREEIRDAYGCDCITESQMDHLFELWDMREQMHEQRKSQEKDYHDYVTDLLDEAMRFCREKFEEEISLYDDDQRRKKRAAEELARQMNEQAREQDRKMGNLFDMYGI